MGIRRNKLIELGRALSAEGVVSFQIHRMELGLSIFIYTDFDGNFGFYSDNELLDFIRIGHHLEKPYILFSLNGVYKELVDKYYKGNDITFSNEILISTGSTLILRESKGHSVILSIPNDTMKIKIMASINMRNSQGKLDDIQKENILNMIDII